MTDIINKTVSVLVSFSVCHVQNQLIENKLLHCNKKSSNLNNNRHIFSTFTSWKCHLNKQLRANFPPTRIFSDNNNWDWVRSPNTHRHVKTNARLRRGVLVLLSPPKPHLSAFRNVFGFGEGGKLVYREFLHLLFTSSINIFKSWAKDNSVFIIFLGIPELIN